MMSRNGSVVQAYWLDLDLEDPAPVADEEEADAGVAAAAAACLSTINERARNGSIGNNWHF